MSCNSNENRAVESVNPGITLCVPSIKEVEAPLGGTSIEYNIKVVSNLLLFRSNSNKDHAVEYSVFKTYREIEDLVNKLKKKHPQFKILTLPKSHVSVEEKLTACDRVMKIIASNGDLIESSSLLEFLGIDPKTKELTIDTGIPVHNQVEEHNVIEEKEVADGSDEKEDFDLFEELVKKEKAKQKSPEGDDIRHKNVPTELFVSSTEQSDEPLIDKSGSSTKIKPIKLQGDALGLFSDIRKPGDVSLFEEQDYGEVITAEDEHLLLVPKKEEAGEMKELLDAEDDQEDVFRVENDLEELMKWNNPSRREPTSSEELKDMDTIRTSTANDQQSSNFGVKVAAPLSLEKPVTLKKPVPPPKPARTKPVPPPKPKASPPSSKPEDTLGQDELDIFKYIEQEEQASTQEASLFD